MTTPPPEPLTPTPAPELKVRVRVLKNRLTIAGGIAAKNATIITTQTAATFHESRAEVEILGTV